MPLLFKNYLKNTRGHFAVQFALLGLPLVVATTFVTDYSKAEKEKAHIKTALDAAVIAAVNNNTLSPSQKRSYAKKHFSENYDGNIEFDLTVEATSGRVDMSASGLSPVSAAQTLGIDGIEIYESSAAIQNSENVICALSLASDEPDTITFRGNSKFEAPTCSVHSNSTSPEAIRVLDRANAKAKNFCAVGGGRGVFQPYINSDCAPVEDPYADVKAPDVGPCQMGSATSNVADFIMANEDKIDSNASDALARAGLDPSRGEGRAKRLAERFQNLTGSNRTLEPGTYCGGLTVDGRNVRFKPGTHIITGGPLIFMNGAQAVAKDVTFVMKGESSVLRIESGSSVEVKAPKKGKLAGLAFFQDVSAIDKGFESEISYPNGENVLSSGGSLNVTGTVYFPTQSVKVVSDSIFGAEAPATSFVAYQLSFDGNADIRVAVDHRQAGLPPIMPRTEDGARLVK